MEEIGSNGCFWQKNTKFWPKLAEPEFSQYVHEVIPVEDPKCSFYNKYWGNRARCLGEIGQNGHFWPKSKFWAKMANKSKTRIFGQKLK